ncbi:MAG: LacI family DNA-binding transcriptional regulator [Lachnospiraceae bacterium]|nr:LacI family DNA-binding transcriptional regulator [Lachnospiraceae bacterium]
MATLKDVAALAHVDVSTVSRALNNTSYVHPDTKARIMAAVKELSYKPNVLAKGLRQGKLNTIAVIIPMLSFSIFAEVTSGIEEAARELGYATIIVNTGNNKTTEKECLNKLRNGFIDGMIIASTGHNNRLIRDISTDMPVVQVIRQFDPRLSSVVVDYVEIGYRSVCHLADKGCRKIGLINGSAAISPYADRYKGYKKAIRERDLEEITAERDSRLRGMKYGYDCTLKLLDENARLDAVLAATDSQGMGAMRALNDNGLSIPDQMRVLSMTGHMVGDMLVPSLTSMELPGFELGSRSAEMLIRSIESDAKRKPSVQHLTLSANLVKREST